MNLASAIHTLQSEFGERMKAHEPLARYTTFKIGGVADLFYEAKTTDELAAVVARAKQLGVPVFILGGGSNILIGDKGVRGLVVRNFSMRIGIKGVKSVSVGGKQKKIVFVEADSGVPINKLVRFTIDEGLSGLHMHLGLPGSVGGALYMNSKWTHPDGYVGDAVYQVRLITATGQEEIKPQSYFHFAYDSSRIQTSKDVVISVVFALTADDKDALWKIANESIAYRRETQPQGILSAGCTFRNLSRSEALALSTPNLTTSAGYLVDHAGLKGAAIGDAYISTQHANFIVNKGKATAMDVIHLIEKARVAVKDAFGVTLKEEIERVGEF